MSFTAEKWLAYKQAILSELCGTTDTSHKGFRAWNKLFIFVISEMKDSYLVAVRNKANSSSCTNLNFSKQTDSGTQEFQSEFPTGPCPATSNQDSGSSTGCLSQPGTTYFDLK